ncbi:MAG: hypothetical protein ACXVII_28255 [Solirubrobacteraceae bacterium]
MNYIDRTEHSRVTGGRALLRRAALDQDGAGRVLEALASGHAIVLIAGPEITPRHGGRPGAIRACSVT